MNIYNLDFIPSSQHDKTQALLTGGTLVTLQMSWFTVAIHQNEILPHAQTP